jgi:hypothetical protein
MKRRREALFPEIDPNHLEDYLLVRGSSANRSRGSNW